jgi:hypothetical protein
MIATTLWAVRRSRFNRLELESASPLVSLLQIKITDLKREGDKIEMHYVLEWYSEDGRRTAESAGMRHTPASPEWDAEFTWQESGKDYSWKCPSSIHIRFFDGEGNEIGGGLDKPFRPDWQIIRPSRSSPFLLSLLGFSDNLSWRYPGSVEFFPPPVAQEVSFQLTPDLTTRPVPLPP